MDEALRRYCSMTGLGSPRLDLPPNRKQLVLTGPDLRLNRDGRFFDVTDAPFAMIELTSLTPRR